MLEFVGARWRPVLVLFEEVEVAFETRRVGWPYCGCVVVATEYIELARSAGWGESFGRYAFEYVLCCS